MKTSVLCPWCRSFCLRSTRMLRCRLTSRCWVFHLRRTLMHSASQTATRIKLLHALKTWTFSNATHADPSNSYLSIWKVDNKLESVYIFVSFWYCVFCDGQMPIFQLQYDWYRVSTSPGNLLEFCIKIPLRNLSDGPVFPLLHWLSTCVQMISHNLHHISMALDDCDIVIETRIGMWWSQPTSASVGFGCRCGFVARSKLPASIATAIQLNYLKLNSIKRTSSEQLK